MNRQRSSTAHNSMTPQAPEVSGVCRRAALRFTCLLLMFAATGCGSSAKEPAEEATPLSGRWLLRHSDYSEEQGFRDVGALLIELDAEASPPTAKLLAEAPAMKSAKITSVTVENGTVTLGLQVGEQPMEFVGKHDRTRVWGNLCFHSERLEPAWLEAMPADASRINASQLSSPPNWFADLPKETDWRSHYSFCQKHPESPVAVKFYRSRLADGLAAEGISGEKYEEFVAESLRSAAGWGPRMESAMKLDIGWELLNDGHLLESGIELLKESLAGLPPVMRDHVSGPVANLIGQAEDVLVQRQALTARNEIADGKVEAGFNKLDKLLAENPFNHVVMYLKAEAARAEDRYDDAVPLYAALAEWPGLDAQIHNEAVWIQGDSVPPASQLLKMWVDRNTVQSGLAEYRRSIYEQGMQKVADLAGKPKSLPETGRNVLVEFFTTADSPACTAAELGLTAVERNYPRPRVIVLRYHQNDRTADPLANAEGADRFATVAGENMVFPTVALNGIPVDFPTGGSIAAAVRVAREIQSSVDSQLSQSTEVRLKLSARLKGDEVAMSIELGGLEETETPHRLVLALAEDDVAYAGRNGVKQHNLVVRSLVGGPTGTPIVDGSVPLPDRPRLSDIRSLLTAQMGIAAKKYDVDFSQQPVALSPLWLVGFVQNSETQEIVQAAAVEVVGSNSLPSFVPEPTGNPAVSQQGDPETPRVPLPPLVPLNPSKPGAPMLPVPSLPSVQKLPATTPPAIPSIPMTPPKPTRPALPAPGGKPAVETSPKQTPEKTAPARAE